MDIKVFGIIPGIRKHRIEKEILSHSLPLEVPTTNKIRKKKEKDENHVQSTSLTLHPGYCGYESYKFQALSPSTTLDLYQIQFLTLRQPTCLTPTGEIITLHSTWKWDCYDGDQNRNNPNSFSLRGEDRNNNNKQTMAIPGIIEKTCEMDEATGVARWSDPTSFCRM